MTKHQDIRCHYRIPITFLKDVILKKNPEMVYMKINTNPQKFISYRYSSIPRH